MAKYFPEKPKEWDEVAKILSKAFSTDDKQVEVKGRGCREKMDRILTSSHKSSEELMSKARVTVRMSSKSYLRNGK